MKAINEGHKGTVLPLTGYEKAKHYGQDPNKKIIKSSGMPRGFGMATVALF